MKKRNSVKGRLATPPDVLWFPDIAIERQFNKRWYFLLLLGCVTATFLFAPVNVARTERPEEVSIVEIQERQSPPPPLPLPPRQLEPQQVPPPDPDEKSPEPVTDASPDPQFGLAEDAMSEEGNLEVATGNSLMTPQTDTIVKPVPHAVVAEPSVNLQEVKNAYLAGLVILLEKKKRYPVKARQMVLEGIVRIRFCIEMDGRISEVSLSGACPHAILNERAKETVEKLAFYKPLPICLGVTRLVLEMPFVYELD